jgi:hypothetical protein
MKGRDADHHIPCHLFHSGQGVAPFSVGPVEFLPRADWLIRYVKDPPSSITSTRLRVAPA